MTEPQRPGDDLERSDELWKDKEVLERLYEDEGYTFDEIGERLGCSGSTAATWLKKLRAADLRDELDVEIPDENPYRDEELMRELYLERELSSTQITGILDCSIGAVTEWLDRHGIETRSLSEAQSLARGGRSDLYVYTNIGKGYERFKSGDDVVLHHRLLAVAKYGFEEVCEKQIHHLNRIHWDNRPENIELIDADDHQLIHSQKLNWVDRLAAAEMYREGASTRDVGDALGVAGTTARNAIRDVDPDLMRGKGGAQSNA